jgi:hypothetical protein
LEPLRAQTSNGEIFPEKKMAEIQPYPGRGQNFMMLASKQWRALLFLFK